MKRSSKHSCNQTGFTLVEVLVALVVLSVGMLGIAGLYVEGLRASKTSIYRTTAVTLAADMANRIRANISGVIPQPPAGAGNPYAGAGPGVNNDCLNPCTQLQLAQDDWWRLTQDMTNRLPVGANANIAVLASPPTTTYTITVSWPETGQAAPSSYALTMQL